ncbi:MAG TPA: class I SAM-dependent methyltransferase [Phycisphaerales bacterium]|nr:class I SAM-dependent methyltransferase [Phycisphaerales bacterium]
MKKSSEASAGKQRGPGRKKAEHRAGAWRTAKASDRFELYELAVQDAPGECELVDQVWKEIRNRTPRSIREDFCASANIAAAWVQRRRGNTAIGVDLDPMVLRWAKGRLEKSLSKDERARLRLVQADVRHSGVRGVDSVLATNFSSFVFKTREAMLGYFRDVHASLTEEGLFILDAYGGYESWCEMEEEKNMDGFVYVWDQAKVNPITNEVLNHIHFKFPDGSMIKKAFTYDWRLWTLAELQDMMRAAGFRRTVVYWEGTDNKTGEGNGEWSVTRRGEACAGWLAYVVGIR